MTMAVMPPDVLALALLWVPVVLPGNGAGDDHGDVDQTAI